MQQRVYHEATAGQTAVCNLVLRSCRPGFQNRQNPALAGAETRTLHVFRRDVARLHLQVGRFPPAIRALCEPGARKQQNHRLIV